YFRVRVRAVRVRAECLVHLVRTIVQQRLDISAKGLVGLLDIGLHVSCTNCAEESVSHSCSKRASNEVLGSTSTTATRKALSPCPLLSLRPSLSPFLQTQRWFRCLEANYLRSKCFFLEKFLAQLLFEVPTPSLLLTFVQVPP
ncbi:unnamed protein product, partial [Discosporangium mesarthrocarpum]